MNDASPETTPTGAYGWGLATLTADGTVLDVWYPSPALGEAPGPAKAGVTWLLIEAFHRRNVTAAYAELEWD